MTEEAKHEPLPVQGYTAQPGSNVAVVNQNKELEERVLRRTHIEQAFMAINRAVFQPQRIALPEDGIPPQESK